MASAKSSVTLLPVRTGTKCDHSGPASNPRMPARNLADLHLSLAGMIVWLSSTVISSSRSVANAFETKANETNMSESRGFLPEMLGR